METTDSIPVRQSSLGVGTLLSSDRRLTSPRVAVRSRDAGRNARTTTKRTTLNLAIFEHEPKPSIRSAVQAAMACNMHACGARPAGP
jgi:hypothetical protein